MFKDVKRGFSFSLGKALFKVGVFFIILVIIMMISSCRAHALALDSVPSEIVNNFPSGGYENYNIVLAEDNFYYPFDSGNVNVFFNYNCSLINNLGVDSCPSHFYSSSSLVWHYISPLDGDYEIMYSFRVRNYSTETNSYRSASWILNDFLYQNQAVVGYWHSVDGVNYAHPTFLYYEQLNNTTLVFYYKIQVHRFYDIYFAVEPWGSSTSSAYRIGFKINQINSWSGAVNSGTIINSTNQIINNNNQNTQQIVTKIDTTHGILRTISSAITNVISAISNIPSLVYNAFSTALSNILTAIQTFWTNLSDKFSVMFDYFDDILNDDEPTTQFIEDFMDEFISGSDNIILEFVSLPIRFLTEVINTNSCSSVTLGTLFNYTITLPCLGTLISSFLGNTLYTIISTIVSAMILWRLCSFLYVTLERVLTLELDLNDDFNIDF